MVAAGLKNGKNILAQVLITQFDNGEVEFAVNNIPATNLLAIRNLMCQGELTLLRNLTKQAMQQNPIVVPDKRIVTPKV